MGAGGGAETRTLGAAGIAVMVTGGTMVLLALTQLAWYGGSTGANIAGGSRDFRDLHGLTKSFDAPSASVAYFDWLAWTLLLALIVVGLLANLPTPVADGFRVLGLLLGMGGSAFTYYALRVLFDALNQRGASGGVFDHARAGLWLALAGYVVAGVGAALGPRPAP